MGTLLLFMASIHATKIKCLSWAPVSEEWPQDIRLFSERLREDLRQGDTAWIIRESHRGWGLLFPALHLLLFALWMIDAMSGGDATILQPWRKIPTSNDDWALKGKESLMALSTALIPRDASQDLLLHKKIKPYFVKLQWAAVSCFEWTPDRYRCWH